MTSALEQEEQDKLLCSARQSDNLDLKSNNCATDDGSEEFYPHVYAIIATVLVLFYSIGSNITYFFVNDYF